MTDRDGFFIIPTDTWQTIRVALLARDVDRHVPPLRQRPQPTEDPIRVGVGLGWCFG
jgi:hypothetical protein